LNERAEPPLLRRFAEYGARDAVQPLPPEVVRHAKRALIDWFAALYPGTRVSPALNLVRAHAAELGFGRSSLPGFGTTAFPATAAWINGAASHSVEFDDIYREAVYHPGCPVISAALALAEDRALDGGRMLAAITIGYEISTRIGAAVQPSHYRYFHTTGTAGVFGAAAAGAALLAPGDATVMRHALATAGTFASGLQQAFRSESMTKPLHSGHAAQVGVTSAMAAAHGVTGAEDLLEGEAGFVAAMSDGARWDLVLPGLGSDYNITRITFKNHGCCGHAFAALDAALELRPGIDPGDIEAVEVESYRAALEVAGIADPQGAPDAKFSIPYLMAHALTRGSVRLDAFDEHHLRDPAIRALLKRVTVREDPAMTADFPGKRAARVRITMQDGRRLEGFAPTRKGDPEAPLSDEEVESKFIELAGPVLGKGRAEILLGRLWKIDTLSVLDLELAKP
jgi:2-methylcitrate dehydratase PrpD